MDSVPKDKYFFIFLRKKLLERRVNKNVNNRKWLIARWGIRFWIVLFLFFPPTQRKHVNQPAWKYVFQSLFIQFVVLLTAHFGRSTSNLIGWQSLGLVNGVVPSGWIPYPEMSQDMFILGGSLHLIYTAPLKGKDCIPTTTKLFEPGKKNYLTWSIRTNM